MGLQLVAQGSILDLPRLANYGDVFAEGDRGELQISLNWPIPDNTVNQIQSSLVNAGVTLWDNVQQAANTLYIRFQVGLIPWAAIIIALGLIAVIFVAGFALYKLIIEPVFGSMAPLVAVLGGLLILSIVLGD